MVLDNFPIPMCHRVISGKVLISSQSILSAQSNKYIRKAATRMYNIVSMQLGEVEPEQFGRQAAKYWGVSHPAASRSKFARPIPSNHVLETHKSFVSLTFGGIRQTQRRASRSARPLLFAHGKENRKNKKDFEEHTMCPFHHAIMTKSRDG